MFNGEKILKNLNMPVLMIHGNKDSLFLLEHAKEMKSFIKNSNLHVIDKGNHVLVLNNIKEISKLIDNFVKKQ
jgi:pimeloyl-ACP methyl ester carboxylesterase